MSFILSTPQEILQALGNRLREQRLAQSMPQSELAERAGLSIGAIRNLEKDGNCSLLSFICVAQTLGLTGELDGLFSMKMLSIAQMEKAEQARKRVRARRRNIP